MIDQLNEKCDGHMSGNMTNAVTIREGIYEHAANRDTENGSVKIPENFTTLKNI